jgi:[ribosomal protein S5]-alanine N-acetyltransferase
MLPTLLTPRLRLRPLEEADVPALFALFSNPAALRFWGHAPFSSIAEAQALVQEARAHAREGTNLRWGVERQDAPDRLIGTASLYALVPAHRRGEVGFILWPDVWGHGYGREVVKGLVAHAFGALHLYRLEADVDPRNAASLRTLEGCGFRREGYLRGRYHLGGEVQDSVLLGLLAPEWPEAP